MSNSQGKYYAVRKGKAPGIYRSWDVCAEQIHGYKGAEYKSFKTLSEAEQYIGGDDMQPHLPDKGVAAFVDGSFSEAANEFAYGVVLLTDDDEIELNGKYSNPDFIEMRNVAGEIAGAMIAMRYCLEHGIDTLTIYHDYEGIARWCQGSWKTNKQGTIAYKRYYDSIKSRLSVSFIKVKGHSGVKYNERADKLAKKALGIE